jgi:hypothetical protein
MKVEMVSKDVNVGENGAKAQIAFGYFFAHPKTKLWRRHLWVGGSC